MKNKSLSDMSKILLSIDFLSMSAYFYVASKLQMNDRPMSFMSYLALTTILMAAIFIILREAFQFSQPLRIAANTKTEKAQAVSTYTSDIVDIFNLNQHSVDSLMMRIFIAVQIFLSGIKIVFASTCAFQQKYSK